LQQDVRERTEMQLLRRVSAECSMWQQPFVQAWEAALRPFKVSPCPSALPMSTTQVAAPESAGCFELLAPGTWRQRSYRLQGAALLTPP
jgi:hypothetical protein